MSWDSDESALAILSLEYINAKWDERQRWSHSPRWLQFTPPPHLYHSLHPIFCGSTFSAFIQRRGRDHSPAHCCSKPTVKLKRADNSSLFTWVCEKPFNYTDHVLMETHECTFTKHSISLKNRRISRMRRPVPQLAFIPQWSAASLMLLLKILIEPSLSDGIMKAFVIGRRAKWFSEDEVSPRIRAPVLGPPARWQTACCRCWPGRPWSKDHWHRSSLPPPSQRQEIGSCP